MNTVKENIIEVLNEKNKPEKIEIIKYFKFENSKNEYIIYKSLDIPSKDKNIIFSAEVIETEDSITLKNIEDENIAKEIERIAKEALSWEK